MIKSPLFRAFFATTTTLALSTIASASYAVSLVPDSEAEIDVGLGCLDLDQCITSDSIPFVESIISVTDDSTNSRSRLFVDDLTTANQYGDPVRFSLTDAGTNSDDVWFRPVAFLEDNSYPEDGQLEVGTYTFNFTEPLDELEIEYFDTETTDTTGVVAINDNLLASPEWVPAGEDGNVFTQTFADVSSITVTLGEYDPNGEFFFAPGDGVRFRLAATFVDDSSVYVPEPGTLIGLAVVGLALAGSKLPHRH